MLQRLAGNRYFANFDQADGSHQWLIDLEDAEKPFLYKGTRMHLYIDTGESASQSGGDKRLEANETAQIQRVSAQSSAVSAHKSLSQDGVFSQYCISQQLFEPVVILSQQTLRNNSASLGRQTHRKDMQVLLRNGANFVRLWD
ncbi:hypothetical protein MP228_012353 [Amoeboaphelidium protococcarum]|nr:hypothetical protein MP228_012353 [Amoeboaphelidium protococcarum]